ncbi:MAG: flagellar type III secretion system protein FlhB [Thermaurantiacus sp.]
MAEAQSGQEKTEAPTERRRKQAEDKGDRLFSRELGNAMSALAGALWLMMFAGDLAAGFRLGAARIFSMPAGEAVASAVVDLVLAFLGPLLFPLFMLAAMVAAAVLTGQALTGGIGLSPGLLVPKPERMNPMKGLGRMFGKKGLVELVKALAKAVLIIGMAGWILWGGLAEYLALSSMPLEQGLSASVQRGLILFGGLSLGLVIIAAGDLPVQLFQWLERLRMTRQELKDELKDTEGRPEVKAAQRRAAREMMRRASSGAVGEATVVVTNPTHFAVALRYRPEADAAPVILAKGRGLLAEVIRELAVEHGVMTLSYPSVARALYYTGRVGTQIREDLFPAVATILAFVLGFRHEGRRRRPPVVEAPTSAQYDEEGRREG